MVDFDWLATWFSGDHMKSNRMMNQVEFDENSNVIYTRFAFVWHSLFCLVLGRCFPVVCVAISRLACGQQKKRAGFCNREKHFSFCSFAKEAAVHLAKI